MPEFLGISKDAFFKKLGVSYGNFKGKAKEKALSSDVVATILTHYPEFNPAWILTGKGQMILQDKADSTVVRDNQVKYGKECESCKEKERLIKSLEQTIDAQQNTIKAQNIALEACQKHCKETHTKKQTTN